MKKTKSASEINKRIKAQLKEDILTKEDAASIRAFEIFKKHFECSILHIKKLNKSINTYSGYIPAWIRSTIKNGSWTINPTRLHDDNIHPFIFMLNNRLHFNYDPYHFRHCFKRYYGFSSPETMGHFEDGFYKREFKSSKGLSNFENNAAFHLGAFLANKHLDAKNKITVVRKISHLFT